MGPTTERRAATCLTTGQCWTRLASLPAGNPHCREAWMWPRTGHMGRTPAMGIYAAPPDRTRHALRLTDACGLIAVCLLIGSLATFALVGAGVLGSAWLAIALGEALLALALVSQRIGDPRRPVNAMKPPDRTFPKSLGLAERDGKQCPKRDSLSPADALSAILVMGTPGRRGLCLGQPSTNARERTHRTR